MATTRPYDAEVGVELADVVQERGGDPAGVVGVVGARELRLHEAGDADGVAAIVTGLLLPLRVRRGESTDSTHATSSGRGGPDQSARRSAPRGAAASPEDEPHQLVLERGEDAPAKPVENTRMNSTRNPYGRNWYQFGSHFSGSTRSISAEPSSGGIGRRLKMPRNRFTEREREEDLDAERQVVEAEVERHRARVVERLGRQRRHAPSGGSS